MGPAIQRNEPGRLDPVAGFVIAAFAIHEGREAWEGELVEGDEAD